MTSDLLFPSIAVWVVFGVLWLFLYLPFRVLPTTIVLITIGGLFLLAVPFEPWLFVATLGGGAIGYIVTRRRPVPDPPPVMQNLLGQAPLDDVKFDQWVRQVLGKVPTSAYTTYLKSGWLTWSDKLLTKYVVVFCTIYRHPVTWSLAAASGFFFVYSLARNSLPHGLQILVVAIAAMACSSQLGMLAKRRRAEKYSLNMQREGS